MLKNSGNDFGTIPISELDEAIKVLKVNAVSENIPVIYLDSNSKEVTAGEQKTLTSFIEYLELPKSTTRVIIREDVNVVRIEMNGDGMLTKIYVSDIE